MKNKIDRREFIKRSVAAGVVTVAGSASLPSALFGNLLSTGIDISVVNGTNYFENTMKAVEMLGGMSKFVPKGSKVGLLFNSVWDKPGTYTNPDVALAVIEMCIDAKASEIYSIKNERPDYWKRSTLFTKLRSEIGQLQTSDERKTVQIEKGISLKEAEMSLPYLECDVIISIPILKHHEGTNMTCSLKHIMGACSRATCRFFHKIESGKGFYDNAEFLSQCIADVNLVRVPNLCVVDATEFIITNGPAGPGDLKKAQKIVAGTHCVSTDSYCATLLGLQPEDVLKIRYAHEHGLGEISLKNLTIKEV
jgi:uncharacterized protein (DUF362 family)